MLLEFLDEKNPTYVSQVNTWAECNALYHGGDVFKDLIDRFLPPNPSEPLNVWETRKQESSYSSYLGPIVDYFVSWLFSGSFTVRPKKEGSGESVDEDPFYAEFREDVGGDVDMCDFMRERMTSAMVKGCSHWLVVRPDNQGVEPTDKADYEARGLGTATLQAVEREEIYDWDVDVNGKLEWCVIHSIESVRAGLGSKRNRVRETWRHYDREDVTTYSTTYDAKKRPGRKFDVPITEGPRPHGCAEVPLVALAVKDGMWVGNRVRAPQIEHFRLTCANAWLIRRTCYAMPVLNLEDTSSIPVMGAGYYIAIGTEETFSWSSPTMAPFDIISKETAAKRDEIFRIVHQMAQGMDNNAETVGRSADSKGLDVAATRIMLNAYGAMVRKAIEETYEILSDARGETHLSWSVEGFNGFDTTSAAELIATAANAKLLGIPSETFSEEIEIKAALSMVPELDQHTKNKIRDEIRLAHAGHTNLDMLAMSPELKAKLEIQKMKDKTAKILQDKKSKTALEIQEIKAADVRLEVQMASGQKETKPIDQAHVDTHKDETTAGDKPGGATKGALNLIKADS